jgi:prepilin-type processing-associated H-X9-DG protein
MMAQSRQVVYCLHVCNRSIYIKNPRGLLGCYLMWSNSPVRTRGLSVVELLACIAIIGVLAAVLFPVVNAMRGRARQATCTSNLRQIHVALSLYIQDSDSLYPAAVNPSDSAHPERWSEFPAFMAAVPTLPQFHVLLRPFTKTTDVFRCPSDNGLQMDEPFPGWFLTADPSSYAVYGTSYFYQSKLSRLRASDPTVIHPSDTMTVMDADGKWHGSASEPQDAGTARRYNLLFADGHVKTLNHTALGTLWEPPL